MSTDRKGYAPMFGVNLHGTGCETAFEALQRESPKKAARYISGSEYRAHLTKHLRRPDHPSDEYDAPITESQRIGWEVERYQRETQNLRKQTSLSTTRLPDRHQYHHKATEISHYNDCVTKHMYGRSIKSEFGAYGQARLEKQAMEDLELSGPDSRVQQPEFGRYTPMQVPAPRSQVLGKTNMPMEGTFKATGEGGSYFKANTSRYGEHFLKTCG